MFRVFGLPVHIRPGFFAFLLLAAVINRGAFGIWLSIAIGVLTLTHELGHALVAKRFGADAEIQLDMLAGYTSYAPTRPMKRWQRALVAFSGPVAEIVPGVLLIIALGANPLSRSEIGDDALLRALWIAGPLLGLFNLLPLLPLDGGNIVALGIDAVVPGRGRRIWLWISIAVTLGGTIALLLDSDVWSMALFPVVLLFLQIQTLRGDRRQDQLRQIGKERTAKTRAIEQLVDAGDLVDAARSGAELFTNERDPDVAMLVARVAARLGELSTSAAWVQAAAHAADDPVEILYEFDHEPDLQPLHALDAAPSLRRSLGA
jgi:Zn-dependent protease